MFMIWTMSQSSREDCDHLADEMPIPQRRAENWLRRVPPADKIDQSAEFSTI
jgi:hypothetical protein